MTYISHFKNEEISMGNSLCKVKQAERVGLESKEYNLLIPFVFCYHVLSSADDSTSLQALGISNKRSN